MPLVSIRQMLDEAARGGYGVGACNILNREQTQAICDAARATRSPVIGQASRSTRGYADDVFLKHLIAAALELYPDVPVARKVVAIAHAQGVTVEGELGCPGGVEDGHGAGLHGMARLTDPRPSHRHQPRRL